MDEEEEEASYPSLNEAHAVGLCKGYWSRRRTRQALAPLHIEDSLNKLAGRSAIVSQDCGYSVG